MLTLRHQSTVLAAVAGLFVLLTLATTGCVSQPSFSPGPTDADAPKEFTKSETGLKYRILRKADGPLPTATNMVKVHYVGTLDDGTEFDSSYRRGKPASFGLSEVVAGWTEGLQLVNEGGMIELEIPPHLGYGPAGAPGAIPPNATLHFIVELIEIL
jgi:FKBP-type peptidyl-prolyl cis-trans isomerase FkpA